MVSSVDGMKKKINKILSYPFFILIPIAFLLIPIIGEILFPYHDIPYFYFVLLRVVVCAFSAFFATTTCRDSRETWPWIFCSIVVLFNPLFPIHMEGNDWLAMDAIVSVIFLIAMFRLKVNPFSGKKIVLIFVGVPIVIVLIISLIVFGNYLYEENFTVVYDEYPPTKTTKKAIRRSGYGKLGKCERVKCVYTDDGECSAFGLNDVLRCTN